MSRKKAAVIESTTSSENKDYVPTVAPVPQYLRILPNIKPSTVQQHQATRAMDKNKIDHRRISRYSETIAIDKLKDLPRKLRQSVFVSREMTENIIPQTIAEEIHDIYNYMDIAMANRCNKLPLNNNNNVIINFGFHEKKSNEELFCILEEQNSGQREWRMLNQLFTAQMIENKYNISCDHLPQPLTVFDWILTSMIPNIKRALVEAKWNKIKVHDKKNNKQRQVLYITNNEFLSKIKQKIENINHQQAIPIIGKDIEVEHVMIMNLTEEVSIGISYKWIDVLNKTKMTGIYLDKDEILLRHQLYNPKHECHCLDHFKSNINELKIGNVYDERNQIKNLRLKNKQLRDEHKNPIIKYIKQILNDVNDLVSKDIGKVLSAIKQIFNANIIKNAINNCTKSNQKDTFSTITTNIPMLNSSNIPISYLTTICGSYATTTPLPPPPLNAALRSIPQQQ